MKPIKLYVHRLPANDDLSGTVRVTPEAEKIIRELRRASGLSVRQIVSEIIIQAADAVEIVEVGS